MIINKYLKRIKSILDKPREARYPLVIMNTIHMDPDLERLFTYDKVGHMDLLAFSVQSLNHMLTTKEAMENGKLDKNPNHYVEKSSYYKLRKFKSQLRDTQGMDWKERADKLQTIYLKGIMCLYMLSLEARIRSMKNLLDNVETKTKKTFSFKSFEAGMSRSISQCIEDLRTNGQIENIEFNLDRSESSKQMIEYLSARKFDSFQTAIVELVSMLDFMLAPMEESQERMLSPFAWFRDHNINPTMTNVILLEALGFILLTNLLPEDQIELWMTAASMERTPPVAQITNSEAEEPVEINS